MREPESVTVHMSECVRVSVQTFQTGAERVQTVEVGAWREAVCRADGLSPESVRW